MKKKNFILFAIFLMLSLASFGNQNNPGSVERTSSTYSQSK